MLKLVGNAKLASVPSGGAVAASGGGGGAGGAPAAEGKFWFLVFLN